MQKVFRSARMPQGKPKVCVRMFCQCLQMAEVQ
jgi:hypothetical protein